jgi:hypothetical protein
VSYFVVAFPLTVYTVVVPVFRMTWSPILNPTTLSTGTVAVVAAAVRLAEKPLTRVSVEVALCEARSYSVRA